MSETFLGGLEDPQLTSQHLVEYANERIQNDGVQAQTVGNDLAHLGAVLSVAKPAWGYDVDETAMGHARKVLKKDGAVSRSKERDRRPALQELESLNQKLYWIAPRFLGTLQAQEIAF